MNDVTEKKCNRFNVFAKFTAGIMGSPGAFAVALALIVGWAICGPFFHYSEDWQLVINTSTTIITFLMVFVIQNTQNRDGKVIQLKIDELIHATKGARNELIDLENLSDEELDKWGKHFQQVCADRRRELRASGVEISPGDSSNCMEKVKDVSNVVDFKMGDGELSNR